MALNFVIPNLVRDLSEYDTLNWLAFGGFAQGLFHGEMLKQIQHDDLVQFNMTFFNLLYKHLLQSMNDQNG